MNRTNNEFLLNKQYFRIKNSDFIFINKKFIVDKLSDIKNVPVDREELNYYCVKVINFSLPTNLRKLRLSSDYKHSLDF